MGPKQKMNQACFNGLLITVSVLGLLTRSCVVFTLVLVVASGVIQCGGQERPVGAPVEESMADNHAKLILAGCGLHARRVYLPALQRFSKETGAQLSLVVDLKAQEDTVHAALAASGLHHSAAWFIDPFRGPLSPSIASELSAFAAQEGVTGVIVATEPLTHRAYAEWAIRQGLSLMLDKPITDRDRAVGDAVA